jgi:alcohol dehydrogenase class IV
MDALTQLIEACISTRRRVEVSALAHRALRYPLDALPRCVETPGDRAARAAMSMAASISGICLANTGLAMTHGIAAALGAWHGVPHGTACGIVLPHALRFLRDACTKDLAYALTAFLGESAADGDTIDRGILAIEDLGRRLGVPPDLKHLNLTGEQTDTLAKASIGNSMRGNPIPMTPDAVLAFIRKLV